MIDPHALDVPRVRHELDECAIEWQRAQLRKFGGARRRSRVSEASADVGQGQRTRAIRHNV
jgi:hypothetical protein